MQVVCSNCQLSFQAPDGATGLVCPICRNPLRAADGSGPVDTAPARQVLDWAGGTLDDLVALLSAPAWSARIEVLPASGGTPAGEVQVIAGGVSDAIYEGKSTHESLDKLRAVPGAKFRIEPRLPNPANGDLAAPGPEQGKLEERPLATLMRYCEEFVLTAGIEVWRASENAKVDYKRGEIVGVTVGGIDAPERLSEVMKWSSGSYRLVVPKLTIPDKAPKAAAPAAVVSARTMGAASKTIFGMPALDPAAIAAAADKARQAKSAAAPGVTPPVPSPAAPPPSAPGLTAPPAAAVSPARPGNSGRSTTAGPATAPATPPAPVPPAAPQAQPAVRASTNRTIFGVAAPPPASQTPATAQPVPPATRAASPSAAVPPAAGATPVAAAPATPTGSGSAARPTTAVSVAPVPAPPPATARTTTPAATPPAALTKAPERAPATAKKQKGQPPATVAEESTQPTKAKPKNTGTPVWTYVGVGFVFGLALLGVYRLVMVLAH